MIGDGRVDPRSSPICAPLTTSAKAIRLPSDDQAGSYSALCWVLVRFVTGLRQGSTVKMSTRLAGADPYTAIFPLAPGRRANAGAANSAKRQRPPPQANPTTHAPRFAPGGRCTADPPYVADWVGSAPQGAALDLRVQRAVAALGGRQAPALGGDRAALHAVRRGDLHVDRRLPFAASSWSSGISYTCAGHIDTQVCATSRGTLLWTRMWLGASSRVALPEANTDESLSKCTCCRASGSSSSRCREHLVLGVVLAVPVAARERALRDRHRAGERAADEEALGEHLAHVAHR